MKDAALVPIVHPQVRDLIEKYPSELFRLTLLLGSPLHMLFPQIMATTAQEFRKVLDENDMKDGSVFYAAKANKANAFLAASVVAGASADASSRQEFSAALRNGIPGRAISVSGPAKPVSLLALAILHDARVAIDEPAELELIIALRKSLHANHPVRVYLRLNTGDTSRFGMTQEVIDEVITHLTKVQSQVSLEGFSFHANGYISQDRVDMISEACAALVRSHAAGLKPNHINIGGGFQNAYATTSDWSLEKATEREFAGNVKPSFIYPYATAPGGYVQFREILEASKATLESTQKIIGQQIMIDLEPGRSMLDQAGISIFRVQGVRAIGKRSLVMIEGNSRSLAMFWRGSEFFLDPFLLTPSPRKEERFTAAIGSNTCLESDYLARRFIPFQSRPMPGDLLVYINTAGYEMDSKESEFHRLPIPSKVAALKGAKEWHFIADTRISPADLITT